MDTTSKKIHLGCGQKYLAGYVNIDYPASEHTVMTVKADVYTDIRKLEYPENSLEEVRNHHVLEHFSRPEALVMLARWRSWLKPGGVLHVETPDFGKTAEKFLFSGRKMRFALARHAFGSQEAPWAYHMDYWDKQKYKYVLGKLGFSKIKIRRYSNSLAQKYPSLPFGNILGDFLPDAVYHKHGGHKLPNIEVWAVKTKQAVNEREVIKEILAESLVGDEGQELLNVWMKMAGF